MKVHQAATEHMLVLLNDTNQAIYVGGRLVAANGGTLEVARSEAYPYLDPNDREHAKFLPAAPVVEEVKAPADPLAELQVQSVKDITEVLPALTSAELQSLRELEAASVAPRSTVLTAIDKVLLDRAANNPNP
jgi:hypothetical protein